MQRKRKWRWQEAKERFLALPDKAVSRRSFSELLLAVPKVPGGLVIDRSRDPGRDVDLS